MHALVLFSFILYTDNYADPSHEHDGDEHQAAESDYANINIDIILYQYIFMLLNEKGEISLLVPIARFDRRWVMSTKLENLLPPVF
jgi:hypothetical protein